jgi:hypothetical protein
VTWQADSTEIDAGRVVKTEIRDDGGPLSFDRTISLWRSHGSFRTWFNTLLSQAPFDAFRFETPPVSTGSALRPFEFVTVNSPSIDRPGDIRAFRGQFENAHFDVSVLTFSNLGGDAQMVVPVPLADDRVYGHIGSFVRYAPHHQQDDLWHAVGNALSVRLSDQPVWLSTAGGGVPWLHVRLDDRPKYYTYSPYRWTSPLPLRSNLTRTPGAPG